ncbi:MAG: potassium channel protein [Gemmatimonadales bacterium]|nr:potassium channel protein [Gemmatimonadales bacterium]
MFDSEQVASSVRRGLVFLCLVLLSGTLWFWKIEEGYPLLDALYMTVITISTVGFKEVHELDASGKAFVVVLIIAGLTILTYTLSSVGRAIVEGSLQRYVGRQRMVREIENIKDHFVICGHGRMGQILCEELEREGVPFVVIDGEAETAEHLRRAGYKVVEGDATEDDVLQQAGVVRARGLVAVVSRDVDNLYITLSARQMCREENPELYILSRATDQQAGEKIKRAGADRAISPYVIGGMRLVQALLRPTVCDFVDIATQNRGLDLMFEELKIGSGGGLHGVAIKDSDIRRSFDVIIIAIKKSNGQMVFNPGPDVLLEVEDVLITMGDKSQLKRLAVAIC